MHKDVHRAIEAFRAVSDDLGSYTGMTKDGHCPVQDADDL